MHTLSLSSARGEAREEVIGLSGGWPQQSVLLMEPHVYAGMPSTHLKFRTRECNLCGEMKPSAPGSITAVIIGFLPSMLAQVKTASLGEGTGQELARLTNFLESRGRDSFS